MKKGEHVESDSSCMVDETSCRKLLDWFAEEGRELPWRVEPRDFYRTLVSELMLQQTQVDRVVGKFRDFITRFPSLEALAHAGEDEVVSAWAGLGYYRRARMLHALARRLSSVSPPRDAESLRTLPGVGPYTAAAVASLVFGEAQPVLDGNVLRIGARVLAFRGDPRRADGSTMIKSWVRSFFHWGRPGAVNESLMELGALVCTPAAPGCEKCPLAGGCLSFRQGCPEEIPRPRKRRSPENQNWVAACLLGPEGLLVENNPDAPILKGLWMPPLAQLDRDESPVDRAQILLPWRAGKGKVLPPVRHSITFRRMLITPVLFDAVESPPISGNRRRWAGYGHNEVESSTLLRKILQAIRHRSNP